MPYDIVFNEVLPVGYAVKSARSGEEAKVSVRGFSSTEDGDAFVRLLEGLPSILLGMLPAQANVPASMVDNLLVIVRRDRSATFYVNELEYINTVKLKRPFEAGQPVYPDDIAEVERLQFDGVSIPADTGYLFLFSQGWRKGIAYDFAPLATQPSQDRDYDIEVLLGQYWAYLQFQHLFKITDDEWALFLGQRWFPFISLKVETVKNMLAHLRAGWALDDMLETVSSEVADNADRMRAKWRAMPVFADHATMFEKALEEFLEKDYISATAILYPRIEGLMRTHHRNVSPGSNVSQGNLVTSVVGDPTTSECFMLLPERFDQYLRNVYFANFDPANPSNLSRHSVGHGVAPAALFDLKAATLGFLTLEQLAFYLP